jgi:hypothetical protein
MTPSPGRITWENVHTQTCTDISKKQTPKHTKEPQGHKLRLTKIAGIYQVLSFAGCFTHKTAFNPHDHPEVAISTLTFYIRTLRMSDLND